MEVLVTRLFASTAAEEQMEKEST